MTEIVVIWKVANGYCASPPGEANPASQVHVFETFDGLVEHLRGKFAEQDGWPTLSKAELDRGAQELEAARLRGRNLNAFWSYAGMKQDRDEYSKWLARVAGGVVLQQTDEYVLSFSATDEQMKEAKAILAAAEFPAPPPYVDDSAAKAILKSALER